MLKSQKRFRTHNMCRVEPNTSAVNHTHNMCRVEPNTLVVVAPLSWSTLCCITLCTHITFLAGKLPIDSIILMFPCTHGHMNCQALELKPSTSVHIIILWFELDLLGRFLWYSITNLDVLLIQMSVNTT